MKYLAIIVIGVVLSGCANPLLNDSWRENSSALDYARLFSIAYKLISREKSDNLEGLAEAGVDTGKFLNYFEATKLAIKAAISIRDGRFSRDVQVSAVVHVYITGD